MIDEKKIELEIEKPEEEKFVDKKDESIVEGEKDPAGIKGKKFIDNLDSDLILLVGDFDPKEKKYQLIDFKKKLPLDLFLGLEDMDWFIENHKEIIDEKDKDAVEGEKIKEKEPWEMRKQTFVNQEAGKELGKRKLASSIHQLIVEQALFEGKPVPESVLKDYPDLVTKSVPELSESEKPKTAEDYEELIMEAKNQGKGDKEIHEPYRKAMEIYEKVGDFISAAEFTERIYGKDDNRTKGAWLKVAQVEKEEENSWIEKLSEDSEEQEKIKKVFEKAFELAKQVEAYRHLLRGEKLRQYAKEKTIELYNKHKKD